MSDTSSNTDTWTDPTAPAPDAPTPAPDAPAAPAPPAAPDAPAPAPDATAPAPADAPASAPDAAMAGGNLTGAEISAIAEQTAALLRGGPAPAAPAPAPAPAAPEPSKENLFTKGQLVTFEWTDHYDGPSRRYGIVVDTLPDEGEGARSIVAWFDQVSGPIGDQLLAEG